MQKEIEKEIIQTLGELRDQHYRLIDAFEKSLLSSASVMAFTTEVFSKIIDTLDTLYYGKEPKLKNVNGQWQKWSR